MLIPFEAALEVVITPEDLRRIAATGATGRWLELRAREWMSFWREEGGREGFVPFDKAAVLYALRPDAFRCLAVRTSLETSPPWFGIGRPTELVVRDAHGSASRLRYCRSVGPTLERLLRVRLDRAVAGRGEGERGSPEAR